MAASCQSEADETFKTEGIFYRFRGKPPRFLVGFLLILVSTGIFVIPAWHEFPHSHEGFFGSFANLIDALPSCFQIPVLSVCYIYFAFMIVRNLVPLIRFSGIEIFNKGFISGLNSVGLPVNIAITEVEVVKVRSGKVIVKGRSVTLYVPLSQLAISPVERNAIICRLRQQVPRL